MTMPEIADYFILDILLEMKHPVLLIIWGQFDIGSPL
jgi:hypothetical protein